MEEFKNLFSPIKLGNVNIKNRTILLGFYGMFFGPPGDPQAPHGAPGERACAFFEARAKGGVGLMVVSEHMATWPTTLALFYKKKSPLESDEYLPYFKKLTDTVHKYDTKIFCQLDTGAGPTFDSRGLGGGSLLAASPIERVSNTQASWGEVPHEADVDDIKEIVTRYAAAARRMKQAGYDGIEIKAISGHLLGSFISQATNKRTDEYGGSLDNRLRFVFEIIDATREAIGQDMALGIRYCADEFVDGGTTLDEGVEIAKKLEATGKLDYIFGSADAFKDGHIPPMFYPLAPWVYISAAIKEVVSLPVFTVGRINDPVLAERILTDNQSDMIGMVRPLICEPEWPNKAREGRMEEIRRCMACSDRCVGKPYQFETVGCSINPEAGYERENAIIPAETKKRVMVIGGGAAGLETARVAALRGHTVSLYEKNDVLAKELSIAAKAPGRQDFEEAIRYYTYQMKLLGVDVNLGVTVTPEMVLKENPDAVVVATGAEPYIPDIPGADGDNVVEMRQILLDEVEAGQNVVVGDQEFHIWGMDTADFLAERGKHVELLTQKIYAGTRLDWHTLRTIYTRLLRNGVIITPVTEVKEIRGTSVVVKNIFTGGERTIEGIDTVVFCTHGRANDTLYRALKGKVKELYMAGQCVSPRWLPDSTADGARAARAI
jgi:2,4-dienoyl-CoA reductase-like NADH-dependent reductase (Old Yellow Enzyme family)/thioredoxin reductase